MAGNFHTLSMKHKKLRSRFVQRAHLTFFSMTKISSCTIEVNLMTLAQTLDHQMGAYFSLRWILLRDVKTRLLFKNHRLDAISNGKRKKWNKKWQLF
jgi:hypothetical protein